MTTCRWLGLLGLFSLLAGPVPAWAQAPAPAAAAAAPAPLPAENEDPVLRLEGQGPLSPVCASAFSPDGGTLYDAGWDKFVRVWKRDGQTGRFAIDPRASLRIPIGPGDAGVMNALAVSPDGRWLAVAGNAVSPEGAGFRQVGLVVPRGALASPWSSGTIYVFDLKAEPPRCRLLAGHPGSVKALAFVDPAAGAVPWLVSAGSEPVADNAAERPALVLRLWDVATQAERDRVRAGTYQGALPWLAAWPSPQGGERVRVAAAWRAGETLVWDAGPGGGGAPRRLADPFQGFAFALRYRPVPGGGGEIVTGHFGRAQGGRWPEGFLAAGSATEPGAPTRRVMLSWAGAAAADEKAIPVALALLASRPGGPRDRAAVVLRRWTPADAPSGRAAYRLQFVDLDAASFGAERGRVALWTGPLADPVLTPSPDGRRLAIVGHPDHAIEVHDVGSLLEGRSAPQRLQGVGEPLGLATFVQRGADRGLRLREAPAEGDLGAVHPPLGPGDLILDAAGRRLAAPGGGWTLDVAQPGAWQSRLVPPRREANTRRLLSPWTLWLYDQGRPIGAGIALRPESRASEAEDLRVTGYALLPPGAGRPNAPIVAIALYEPGVGPTLWLHDGRTGARLRQLSGHTAAIRSLSFSGDGRLLVTAGEDRTACAWSLTDLAEVAGVKGGLSGLALAAKGGQFVVSEYVPEPGRAAADLRTGDVLEGVVEGGRLVPPGSVSSFYFAAAARRPGQSLTLRRRRGAEAARDVAFVLGQAADERKPLFSLFLSRPEAGAGLEWLAWNPFGPYDASGPAVESRFGWHFNAFRNPGQPARFALASQYPKFRREGLVRELLAAGRLAAAEPEPPIARPPDMAVLLDPQGERDAQGRLVFRAPPTVLGLSLDDAVPAARIRSLTWQLDDGPARPLRFEEPDWSAELSGIAWDRLPRGSTHVLTVVLTTDERSPQRFRQVERLRYVPRPQIRVRVPAEASAAPIVAEHRNFRIAAEVTPAPNAPARVALVCRNGETVVVRKTYGPLRGALALDETIDLPPGSNRITIEAASAEGPAELEAEETTRFGPLTVEFHPDPTRPPSIGFETLTPLSADGRASGTPEPVAGLDRVIASAPRLRLAGTIRGTDPIVRVERSEDGRIWNAVANPPAPGAKTFALGETLTLAAGRPATVHVRAITVNPMGIEARAVEALQVEYRPPLPRVEDLAVAPGGPLVLPGTDGEPQPLVLSARLLDAPPDAPVEAAVLLGEDELADPPALDLAAGTLTARVRPVRGRNEIRVRLKNRWSTSIAGPIFVEYRRPPKVEPVEANVQGGRPSALVSAFVVSQTPLTEADVEVETEGGAGRVAPPVRVALDRRRDAGDLWIVSGAVPLEPGENTLVVRARNEDGPASAVRRRIRYEKPVPPKPEIGLVETAEQAIVSRPRFVIRFVVRSTSPLERVALVRERGDSAREVVRAFDRAELGRGGRQDGDVLEWPGEAAVALEPAVNAFRIVAVNAGGEASKGLTLTYTCPPVRVEALEVVPRPAQGAGPPPAPRPPTGEGADAHPTVPEGRALLRGQVVWIDQDPERVKEVPRVQVWVNGFPQVAAELGAARARGREQVRDFRAEVLLSKPENSIEVRLRDLPLEIQGQPRLPVACLKPDGHFQLHLLVISIGDDDEQAVRQRALEALNGRDMKGNDFSTPAFSRARLYGPHCPRVPRERINGELFRIRRAIRMDTRASNDVVILFYQGTETFEDNEPSLRLSATRRPGYVYRLADLRERLEQTRGAKLFLLDVTHTSTQTPQALADSGRWVRDDSPFGLLRFSRPGETAPEEAGLAVTLRDAVQDSVTLGQVNARLQQRVVSLREQFPGARYDPELPPPLEALVIGGR